MSVENEQGGGTRPRAFILIRQTGSYSDFRECPVGAFLDEVAAHDARDLAEREWAEACGLYVSVAPPEGSLPDDDPRWLEWDTLRNAENAKFAGLLTVDPAAAPSGEWDDPVEPDYVVWAVPFASPNPETQHDD